MVKKKKNKQPSDERPSSASAAEAVAEFKIGEVVEPTSSHKSTIICLHGLGDEGSYWQPFFRALASSLGADFSGTRLVFLEAPRRVLWGERMAAWFEYLSDRSGCDEEDEICLGHLAEMRTMLHELIAVELRRLRASAGEEDEVPRLLLLGSSQGGSMACDAALTLRDGRSALAGVVMLRSLVLSQSVLAAGELALPEDAKRIPLLAVSGEMDDTFILSLVKRNLALTKDLADVQHVTVSGLDHMSSYNAVEAEATLQFIAERLHVTYDRKADVRELERFWTSDGKASAKSWEQLSDREQLLAVRLLGCRSAAAWDDGSAKVWEQPWLKLSHLQRQAARQLGFTEDAWDRKEARVEEDPACDRSWADLSEPERQLAKTLGVTGANAWDNGTAPVWSKAWRKLSAQQQKAAEQLGFTEKSWEENN